MNNVFAKTKSGLVINLDLVYRNQEVVCDAIVGDKKVLKVPVGRVQGKQCISLSKREVMSLLGIDTGKNLNSLIEIFGDFDAAKTNFENNIIDGLKIEASKVSITRIKFAYSTSLKYCCFQFFDGESRIADDVVRYNDFCNRITAAIKSIDKKEFESLVYDIDNGDYSITTYYEVDQAGLKNIIYAGEAKSIEISEKKEAARVAETQKCEAIFEQAKVTGERVILSQIFLSGSNIPRRYCDDESDMGHLITWANPDGTTSESFSHAY
jgi:hypothetical protein